MKISMKTLQKEFIKFNYKTSSNTDIMQNDRSQMRFEYYDNGNTPEQTLQLCLENDAKEMDNFIRTQFTKIIEGLGKTKKSILKVICKQEIKEIFTKTYQ